MSYYIAKRVDLPFELVVESVAAELEEQGFGVLTDIDLAATLDRKLGKRIRPYRILGACNPAFAHRALLEENKIGALLPCNVIVQQLDGQVEIAAVDPVASMQVIDNERLAGLAGEVRARLQAAVEAV